MGSPHGQDPASLEWTIEIEQPEKPLEWNFEVTSKAASKKKKKARLTWSFEVTKPSEIPPKSTTSSTPHHHAGQKSKPKKHPKPVPNDDHQGSNDTGFHVELPAEEVYGRLLKETVGAFMIFGQIIVLMDVAQTFQTLELLPSSFQLVVKKKVQTTSAAVDLFGCGCQSGNRKRLDAMPSSYPESSDNLLSMWNDNRCIHEIVAESLHQPDVEAEIQFPLTIQLTNVDHLQVCIITSATDGQIVRWHRGRLRCDCGGHLCNHVQLANLWMKDNSIEPQSSNITIGTPFNVRTVSTQPIPSDSHGLFDRVNLLDGLRGLVDIDGDGRIILCPSVPNTPCSKCGSQWSINPHLVCEATIYTSVGALPAKVYQITCSSTVCDCLIELDGLELGLLNKSNSLLFTHELLRRYYDEFAIGYVPIVRFFEVTSNVYQRNHQQFCSYSTFRDAWYGFLRLQQDDLTCHFRCPLCDNDGGVKTVVMDGHLLGFHLHRLLALPPPVHNIIKSTSGYASAMFFSTKSLSNKVLALLQSNVSVEDFEELKTKLSSEFSVHHSENASAIRQFLIDVAETEADCVIIPKVWHSLLKDICSLSPVCGWIPPQSLAVLDRLTTNGQLSDLTERNLIDECVPVISAILTHFSIYSLPPVVQPLVRRLVATAQNLFLSPPAEPGCAVQTQYDILQAYGYPRQRHCPSYDCDGQRDPICTKQKLRHPNLSPGLFLAYCGHGICLGFQALRTPESPKVAFQFLLSRFQTAPTLVIYDNACHLQAYCLKREPHFFKNTLFRVDRFHWSNHTACASGLNLAVYAHLRHINSQIAEQQNSQLIKLRSQLSYMSVESFMSHTIVFLAESNKKKLKDLLI